MDMDWKDALNLLIATFIVNFVLQFVQPVAAFVKLVPTPIDPMALIGAFIGFIVILWLKDQMKSRGWNIK